MITTKPWYKSRTLAYSATLATLVITFITSDAFRNYILTLPLEYQSIILASIPLITAILRFKTDTGLTK